MMDLNTQAYRIRLIEEEIAKRYPEGEIRCPIHLSIGQEAQAVGVCAALIKDDQMVSTHRSHAHYLAKGGDLKAMIGELYGKSFGCSKGHGGSMHLIDESVGFMGSTSIVGGTIPVGVGLAFANKINAQNKVSVICMGDAALEEGVFHEAANFASLHKLKVVFVVENNFYSCFTDISKRQPGRPMRAIAEAHGLNFASTKSQDPFEIKKIMALAKASAPSLIELQTWRHKQHCGPDEDDHLDYRNALVNRDWRRADLVRNTNFEEQIRQEIKEAFEYARADLHSSTP